MDPNNRWGVDNTVIDCEWAGRGFSFISGEDGNSVLDGLTVTHAKSSAVYCDHSSPTIKNCNIVDNAQGIYCALCSSRQECYHIQLQDNRQ